MLNLKVVFKILTQVSLRLLLVVSLTGPLAVFMTGCGNKGELYLETDAEAAKALEEAAEKLKKKGNNAKPDAPAG